MLRVVWNYSRADNINRKPHRKNTIITIDCWIALIGLLLNNPAQIISQLHCWQLSKIILKLTFCIRLSEISGNSVFEQTHSTMLLNIGQYWLCEFQTPRPRIWDLTGTSHFQYYNIIVAQNTDKQKHPNARFVLGAFRMQNFRSLQMNKSILPGNTTRIRHWIVLWKEGLAISN